ncbi:MAG: universal stress protein [Actinomycetota bacterium]
MLQQADDTRVIDDLPSERGAVLSSGTPSEGFRILFATDGSQEAEAAARFLRQLPLPPGSAIEALTVVDAAGWPETPVWYLESGHKWASDTVEQARAELMRRDVDVTMAVRVGARGHEIIHAAEEFDADLLVLAAHELSRLEEFWLGSITRNVARHAACPVLIAREPVHHCERVVLAVDESEHSSQAADFVARLPLPENTVVTVLHVARPYQPFPGLVPSDPVGFQREVETVRRKRHQAGAALVEQVARRLETAGKRVTTSVQTGDPATEVLRQVTDQNADLVVMGARGVSLLRGLVIGSVADRLLENAPCSVILVR